MGSPVILENNSSKTSVGIIKLALELRANLLLHHNIDDFIIGAIRRVHQIGNKEKRISFYQAVLSAIESLNLPYDQKSELILQAQGIGVHADNFTEEG